MLRDSETKRKRVKRATSRAHHKVEHSTMHHAGRILVKFCILLAAPTHVIQRASWFGTMAKIIIKNSVVLTTLLKEAVLVRCVSIIHSGGDSN